MISTPIKLPDETKSLFIKEVGVINKQIKDLENIAHRFQIDISNDKSYQCLLNYKCVLENLINCSMKQI